MKHLLIYVLPFMCNIMYKSSCVCMRTLMCAYVREDAYINEKHYTYDRDVYDKDRMNRDYIAILLSMKNTPKISLN